MKHMQRILIVIVMLATLMIAGAASADATIVDPLVHTNAIPLQSTNWTETMSVPQFNPADFPQCTLTKVEIEVKGSVQGSAAYENKDAGPATITLDLQAELDVKGPGGTSLILIEPSESVSELAGAYDGTDDFAGTSGNSFPDLQGDESATVVLTDPADLALFTGTGTVGFPTTAMGSSVGSGAGNLLTEFSTQAGTEVTVRYSCDALDLGDLPDSSISGAPDYATTIADDGARHIVTPDLYLGTCVDSESDGQPSGSANEDDLNLGTVTGTCVFDDDEDGVMPTPGVNWGTGTAPGLGSVDVTVQGDGCLSGWIDWNGNGDFSDTFELVVDRSPVTTGSQTLQFFAPTPTGNQEFYARFRLYPQDDTGGCSDPASPVGLADGGEVEDYVWGFSATAVTLQSVSVDGGSSVRILVVLASLLALAAVTFKLVSGRKQAHDV